MSNWYVRPFGGWSFSNSTLFNINGSTHSLHYAGNDKTFLTNKTYLYRTRIKNLKTLQNLGIYIRTPWNDRFANDAFASLSTNDGYINIYSSPTFRVDSSNNSNRFFGPTVSNGPYLDHYSYVSYQDQNNKFGPTSAIYDIEIKEIDWQFHGYSWVEAVGLTSGTLLSNNNNGRGWSYKEYEDTEFFEWYDSTGGALPATRTTTPVSTNANYREINHLSRYINFNFFNLYFTTSIAANGGFKIYLSENAPYRGSSTASFANWIDNSDLIATYDQPGVTFSAYFGLKGNRYVSIVADKVDSGSTSVRLFELRVEGGYADINNRQYLIDQNQNYELINSLDGVTYSTFIGVGDTYNENNEPSVDLLYSKIGNGSFQSGIWENGVWNNGWRFDESVREFDEVSLSSRIRSDVRWRFRVIGPSSSVSAFKLGDEITIGNIIAVDINEKRRSIRDRYRVININPNGINDRIGFIEVEIDTSFPIRRIERDSKKHKIKVTKNIWLSGAFLNGYFTGIWNYGLFKGYPLITEMFNTNWIDGIFEGGHFHSEYYISGTFSNVVFKDNKVGLIFSQPHNLAVGDVINIQMDDTTINSSYNTETTVFSVISDTELVTNIEYGVKKLGLESGSYTTEIATSVIQNMTFDSNNISRTTSIDSLNTSDVFIYNSWVDVNYLLNSAVNIGKPQTKINQASRKSYSENNLYGYPTDDVLQSNSIFRDSYTLNRREYKLGNKYKKYNDYVGDSSIFTEYFGTSSQDTQLFLDQGWTFSAFATDSITFSRTNDEGVSTITGEELIVEATSLGGVLDINDPSSNINNRNLEKIEKNRYSMVEFDLVTYSVAIDVFDLFKVDSLAPSVYKPLIHFNNINSTLRVIGTQSSEVPAEYLPVYRNIEHVSTTKKRKVEFFFNKKNLSMNFRGSGINFNTTSKFTLNNLKIYEVDMIPFFQYFINVNINRSIQIPYQGIAPYIDYSNSDFSFIDSINIGLDSIDIESTSGLFSGVGQGIVTGGVFNFGSRR